jgi:hypothetical protein
MTRRNILTTMLGACFAPVRKCFGKPNPLPVPEIASPPIDSLPALTEEEALVVACDAVSREYRTFASILSWRELTSAPVMNSMDNSAYYRRLKAGLGKNVPFTGELIPSQTEKVANISWRFEFYIPPNADAEKYSSWFTKEGALTHVDVSAYRNVTLAPLEPMPVCLRNVIDITMHCTTKQ